MGKVAVRYQRPKTFRRYLWWVLGVLLIFAAYLQLAGHSYFWTALRYTYLSGHNTAHIDDARNFAQAPIRGGAEQAWVKAPRQAVLSSSMQSYLQSHQTAAFLVAHQGRLLHETYFAPYNVDSRTNVFSMAKTLTTLLLGAAVDDNFIPSAQAPVGPWLPEYANHPRGKKATLAQLSAMTSGHEWSENYYLPLNPTTELYFGGRVQDTVLRYGFERTPGTEYEYNSASTQLLGIALQRALQQKRAQVTLSDYLSQKLWQPLGLADATWSLDRPREDGGMEMTYCCVHARARDMLRVGQLLLQNGEWNGQQLVPASFVQMMSQPNGYVRYYGHGLWTDPDAVEPFYFMQGHLGQYVIVIPSKQLVVLRTGQYRTMDTDQHPVIPQEVYLYVQEALRMLSAQ